MSSKKQSSILSNKAKIKIGLEIIIVIALSVSVFIASVHYEFLERLVELAHEHENWELDEFIVVAIFLLFVSTFFLLRQWRRLQRSKKIC